MSGHGYPPHDHEMVNARTDKGVKSCGGPLVPPEQGRVRYDGTILYCPKCKAFLRASLTQIEAARAASKADGLAARKRLPEWTPPETKRRSPVKPEEATLNLFADPLHAARLRLDGTAR